MGASGRAGAGSQALRVQPLPKSVFRGILVCSGFKLALMGAFSAEIGQCRPPGEPGVKTLSGTHWKRWLTDNDKLKQSWRLIHIAAQPQNP